jgi:hypothetical protein
VRAEVIDLEAGVLEVCATVVRLTGKGTVLQLHPKSEAGWRVIALPPHVVEHLGHAKPSMTQDVHMGRNVASAEAANILDKGRT